MSALAAQPRTTALAARTLAVVAVFMAAALIHVLTPTATDISWLIVVADRMLSGERLYVDVLEVNPPASVLLYIPAVIAERLTGLRAETGVVIGTLLAAALAMGFARTVLDRAGLWDPVLKPDMIAIVLLVFPCATFAQREHFTLLGLLPVLALIAARSTGATIPRRWAVAAGLAAGLAMAVKPMFALVILLPALWMAATRRSPRAIVQPEYVIAGLVVVAYGAAVLVFFPAFRTEMLPLVSGSYLHDRLTIFDFLQADQMLYTFALLAIGIATDWKAGRSRLVTVLALAALGAWGAGAVQGKGWPYHMMPFVALAALTALVSNWRMAQQPGMSRISLAVTIVGFGLVVPLTDWMRARAYDYDALARDFAPHMAGRTVIAVSADLGVGQPVTRMTGARYVGRLCSTWMTDTAGYMDLKPGDPGYAEAAVWAARDRAILAEDIRTKRPDVILVEEDFGTYSWTGFLRADPQVGDLLAGYRKVARSFDVDLWQRVDPPS